MQGKGLKTLDVGCGPGCVMEIMRDAGLGVEGVDCDVDMVEVCSARGLKALVAKAESLPFPDSSFDLVYCSYLLLWVKDPVAVLKEMSRVSRHWVVSLAEPDYGGWLEHPSVGLDVGEVIAKGLAGEGADPYVGRKLRSVFASVGLKADIGQHPGVWSQKSLEEEAEALWGWVEHYEKGRSQDELRSLKSDWMASIRAGTKFVHGPVFYAIARKG